MLATLYIVYTLVRSMLNPSLGPPVPVDERITDVGKLAFEFFSGVVPLLVLIAATLGTILTGMATATEAASCGAVGATLLAIAYRKLTFAGLKEVSISTLTTSSMVLFLAVASSVFGAVFTKLGAAGLITGLVASLPIPDMGKILVIMGIIFLLGWPFEWPAIVLIFLPIFLPTVEALDVGLSKQDMLLWFGVAVAVNMQTAFLSPPVAMSAYFLKNVMPQWSLGMIYRGMSQFMVVQVGALGLLLIWPEIVLWLPRLLR
jgi:TRAP-type mannitol/chloroaromatic compound transport system permease large subunit